MVSKPVLEAAHDAKRPHERMEAGPLEKEISRWASLDSSSYIE